MPTLRLSLGYMTSTARVGEDSDADTELGHRMVVLGVHADVLYVAEDLGDGDEPIGYRMYLDGPRKGHLVPAHGELPATFEPCTKTTTEAWMLSTRVVQRRALRIEGVAAPIRKFALQIRVEPVSGLGANGATTVTAFLRPDARLLEVVALPGGRGMLARVEFTGVPSGLGLAKETVVLLSE